jgi:hypothetical protein
MFKPAGLKDDSGAENATNQVPLFVLKKLIRSPAEARNTDA